MHNKALIFSLKWSNVKPDINMVQISCQNYNIHFTSEWHKLYYSTSKLWKAKWFKNTWILTCKICVFNAYYTCISHAKCVLKSAHKLFKFTTSNMCIICLKYTWPSIQNCKISNRHKTETRLQSERLRASLRSFLFHASHLNAAQQTLASLILSRSQWCLCGFMVPRGRTFFIKCSFFFCDTVWPSLTSASEILISAVPQKHTLKTSSMMTSMSPNHQACYKHKRL